MSEFYACHNFLSQIRRSISTKCFDFYSLTYHIANKEFDIFITYNSALFDIDALIVHITESVKNSDLFMYDW